MYLVMTEEEALLPLPKYKQVLPMGKILPTFLGNLDWLVRNTNAIYTIYTKAWMT